MSVETGTRIGERFEVTESLGSGGAADVFAATDAVLHREVAIKLLRDTTVSDSDRERFAAEARTLASLNHPGLTMVWDAGEHDGRPYLVMELVRGETLGDRCQRGALEPAEVSSIGALLAGAVEHAHGAGILHRDVKPGNVLLGNSGEVKLADFGIARMLDATTHHTATGQTIGTAAYLSPEQVRGDDLAPATDIYSLGLVLLEALTGRRAFTGTPTEAAVARLSRSPGIPDSLPGSWADLLREMTAAEPGDRPDAGEVTRRLGSIDDESPNDAGETMLLTRTSDVTQRREAVDTPPQLAPEPKAAGLFAGSSSSVWLKAGAAFTAALLLLVLLAVLLGAGDTDEAEPEPRPVPADTPEDLQGPLQDLHDAVEDAR